MSHSLSAFIAAVATATVAINAAATDVVDDAIATVVAVV